MTLSETKRGYIHAFNSAGKLIGLFHHRVGAESFLKRAGDGSWLSEGPIYLTDAEARKNFEKNLSLAADFNVAVLFDVGVDSERE